jgi:hypothetical protein
VDIRTSSEPYEKINPYQQSGRKGTRNIFQQVERRYIHEAGAALTIMVVKVMA